jgi:hypothetical protein
VFERFSFQAFEKVNFQGQKTELLGMEQFYDLGFSARSYVWLPKPDSDNCCVTFCAGKKESTGYRCEPRKRNATEGGKAFTRVQLWCGRGDPKTVAKKSQECS